MTGVGRRTVSGSLSIGHLVERSSFATQELPLDKLYKKEIKEFFPRPGWFYCACQKGFASYRNPLTQVLEILV